MKELVKKDNPNRKPLPSYVLQRQPSFSLEFIPVKSPLMVYGATQIPVGFRLVALKDSYDEINRPEAPNQAPWKTSNESWL